MSGIVSFLSLALSPFVYALINNATEHFCELETRFRRNGVQGGKLVFGEMDTDTFHAREYTIHAYHVTATSQEGPADV